MGPPIRISCIPLYAHKSFVFKNSRVSTSLSSDPEEVMFLSPFHLFPEKPAVSFVPSSYPVSQCKICDVADCSEKVNLKPLARTKVTCRKDIVVWENAKLSLTNHSLGMFFCNF